MKEHVEALVRKAAEAANSEDAMRYSQGACNAAKAMRELHDIAREEGDDKK